MPEQTALAAILPHTIETGQVRTARLAAAVAYVRRGWPVVPVRGKRPLVPWREFQRRRPTEDELRRWLETDPPPELAVVTGAFSGLLVLDVDGDAGERALAGRHMPITPMAWTPRGRHIFLRHPGGRVPSRTNVLPGVDIRADGGLVVVPPAEGREWVDYLSPDDVPLADPPAWLLELLSADRERVGGGRAVSFISRAGAYRGDHTSIDIRGDHTSIDITNIDTSIHTTHIDTSIAPRARATDAIENQADRAEDGIPRAPVTPLQPLHGAALQRWFDNTNVGIRVAAHLGLPIDGLATRGRTKAFRCPLHPPDENPSAGLMVHDSGGVVLHCFHRDARTYGLPELAALLARRAVNDDSERPVHGPELAAWAIRLLIETGHIAPARVDAVPLPDDAPDSVQRVYKGFVGLLQAKWLHTPGEPTSFAWRFAAAWCGTSAATVQRAMSWLLQRGYIRKVGEARGAYGRDMALFVPGTYEDVAERAKANQQHRKEEAR